MDLNRFKKQNTVSSDKTQTTVNITQKQKDFIDDNELNLSKIVRDALENIMRDTNKTKERKK